ncbi:MAG: acyl-CoA desaturase [Thiotrichales bacterium]|nr:MAG: acyl-CoA desaturase [Thiotrichales bacterium]
MSFYGLLHLPWWGYVIFTLIMTHITMVSVTVYLHRHQAHRALELHPIAAHFFRFWLWMTTGMKTKEWVAVHRKHHAACETPNDPHSPIIEGINAVLFGGTELYRKEKKNKDTIDKYGKGTPSDWVEKYVYSAKFARGKQGIAIMLAINIFLMGVPGIIVWAIQMSWTPFFAAGVINGIGHYVGYRNFECKDASRNIVPWGILIAGEELHNNHHAYANSAKLSLKWWEVDVGWMYIKTMSLIGLAKVKYLPPKVVTHKKATSHEINLETVKAIIDNRMQLFARYAKKVVNPILKMEIKTTSDLAKHKSLKGAKRLINKNAFLIHSARQEKIDAAIASSQTLATVCSYRDKLHAIWETSYKSNKELSDAIRAWCISAKNSEVLGLEEFANYLCSYALSYRHG